MRRFSQSFQRLYFCSIVEGISFLTIPEFKCPKLGHVHSSTLCQGMRLIRTVASPILMLRLKNERPCLPLIPVTLEYKVCSSHAYPFQEFYLVSARARLHWSGIQL